MAGHRPESSDDSESGEGNRKAWIDQEMDVPCRSCRGTLAQKRYRTYPSGKQDGEQ